MNAWRITVDNLRLPVGTASTTVRVSSTRTAIYTKEPYQDQETLSWSGFHGIYLIFPAIPGAFKYNVTWHANGTKEPDEWFYVAEWMYPQRYAAGDGLTSQFCGYGYPCYPYTTPENIDSLLGVAEDPNAALRSGEVAVPMYVSGGNGDKETIISSMNETRKFVDFFVPWSGDVTIVPY